MVRSMGSTLSFLPGQPDFFSFFIFSLTLTNPNLSWPSIHWAKPNFKTMHGRGTKMSKNWNRPNSIKKRGICVIYAEKSKKAVGGGAQKTKKDCTAGNQK